MKVKKFLSIFFIIVLSFNLMTISIGANEIMPRWTNIRSVYITHGLHEGKALCSITINGYTGTNKIDNIDVKLYQIVGNALVLVARWDDLSTTGSSYEFYGEADDVVGGYTYRLAVTADVHRYGIVEQLDTYGDIDY